MTPRIGWPLTWTLVGLLIVLLEGIALGRPTPGDTLSEAVRNFVRFDALGRCVFLPLWCWLTWHWVLRPERFTEFGWGDVSALGIGIVWAVVELWKAPGGI
jgi:hypothetical protein